jgi:hypothetical protein
LKPGGRLILRVPNGASTFSGALLWSDLTHERPFTKMSCKQLLQPLGFEHIEALEKCTDRKALFKPRFGTSFATGQLRGHILTVNLHLIAYKAAAAAKLKDISGQIGSWTNQPSPRMASSVALKMRRKQWVNWYPRSQKNWSASLAFCAPHVHIVAMRQGCCRRCPPWAFPP